MNQSVPQVADQSIWPALVGRHHELLRASAIGGMLPAENAQEEGPVQMALDEGSREIWT